MMRKHSFTMLEMVAVLLIITVVSLLALQGFRSGKDEAETHGQALLTMLSNAHSRAMNEGKLQTITWVRDEHAWRYGEKRLAAPERVSVLVDNLEPEDESAVFAFFPDGSAQAARVMLQSETSMAEIRCFPLSGSAKLVTPEVSRSETPEIEPLWVKETGL